MTTSQDQLATLQAELAELRAKVQEYEDDRVSTSLFHLEFGQALDPESMRVFCAVHDRRGGVTLGDPTRNAASAKSEASRWSKAATTIRVLECRLEPMRMIEKEGTKWPKAKKKR